MSAPTCAACGRPSAMGGSVFFPEEPGGEEGSPSDLGHPTEPNPWFCPEHLAIARSLTHLPSSLAIPFLSAEARRQATARYTLAGLTVTVPTRLRPVRHRRDRHRPDHPPALQGEPVEKVQAEWEDASGGRLDVCWWSARPPRPGPPVELRDPRAVGGFDVADVEGEPWAWRATPRGEWLRIRSTRLGRATMDAVLRSVEL